MAFLSQTRAARDKRGDRPGVPSAQGHCGRPGLSWRPQLRSEPLRPSKARWTESGLWNQTHAGPALALLSAWAHFPPSRACASFMGRASMWEHGTWGARPVNAEWWLRSLLLLLVLEKISPQHLLSGRDSNVTCLNSPSSTLYPGQGSTV